MRVAIRGARVLDPTAGTDVVRDVFVVDGRITADPGLAGPAFDLEFEARGHLLMPGLVDAMAAVHDIRDLEAAANGGYTRVFLTPGAPAALDDAGAVRARIDALRAEATTRGLPVEVLPVGALTIGLKGSELAELWLLREAGCRALSQGGQVVADARTLRHALEYARSLALPVLLRPVEGALEAAGLMREGPRSVRLGVPGVPPEAEEIGVHRIASLARLTGARVVLVGVWSALGVAALRAEMLRGTPISGVVFAHHLKLTDALVEALDYDPVARFVPPLGDEADRAALIAALVDGTLAGVATDHRPVARHLREHPLGEVPPGAVGLRAALPLALEALGTELGLARALSAGPAEILGAASGTFSEGARAEWTLVDPAGSTAIRAPLGSQENTPLLGTQLPGRVIAVMNGDVLRVVPPALNDPRAAC